jgi:hypothetical protein
MLQTTPTIATAPKPRRLAVWLAALCCQATAWAQPALPSAPAGEPVAKDFQMVQRIDDVLVGVDTISLEVLGSRHVLGSYFLINLRQPSPIAGRADFVADCQSPPRIATLSSTLPSGSLSPDAPVLPPQRRAGRIDVSQLAFSNVHMLDGTWLVAEFACQASGQPGRAVQLARKSMEMGGPPDMQTLYCDLQTAGKREVRRGVEIRYSEGEDAVVVNRQWLSSGYVTDKTVVFGSAAQWEVERGGRRARLINSDGKVLFTGACSKQARSAAP